MGKAINPQAVEARSRAAPPRVLGLALLEEVQVTDGVVRNPSFTDYLMPTILDMPPMRVRLFEFVHPDSPYGLNGVGEPPTLSSTPAIVNALRDATATRSAPGSGSTIRPGNPPVENADECSIGRVGSSAVHRPPFRRSNPAADPSDGLVQTWEQEQASVNYDHGTHRPVEKEMALAPQVYDPRLFTRHQVLGSGSALMALAAMAGSPLCWRPAVGATP